MDEKTLKLLERAVRENLTPESVAYIMKYNGYDQSSIDVAVEELKKKRADQAPQQPSTSEEQMGSGESPSAGAQGQGQDGLPSAGPTQVTLPASLQNYFVTQARGMVPAAGTDVPATPQELLEQKREFERKKAAGEILEPGGSDLLRHFAEEDRRQAREIRDVLDAADAEPTVMLPGMVMTPETAQRGQDELIQRQNEKRRQANESLSSALGTKINAYEDDGTGNMVATEQYQKLRDYQVGLANQAEYRINEFIVDEAKRTAQIDPVLFGATGNLFSSIPEVVSKTAGMIMESTGIIDEEAADYAYEQYRQRRMNRYYSVVSNPEMGISESIENGEFNNAFQQILFAGSDFIPQIAVSIALPGAGITYGAMSAASSTYDEYRNRMDLTPSEKLILVGGAGVIEAVAEKLGIGDIKLARKFLGIAAEEVGTKVATQKALKYLTPISKGFIPEFTEEFGVSLANQALAMTIAGEKFSWRDAFDEGLIGGIFGATTVGVPQVLAAGANGMASRGRMKQFKQITNQIAAIQDALANPEITDTERALLKEELVRLGIEQSKLTQTSVKDYEAMSEEDQKELVGIHAEINEAVELYENATDKTAKSLALRSVKRALDKKAEIESRYDSKTQTGLRGTQQEGQDARTVPQPGTGTETSPADRVVQTPQTEVDPIFHSPTFEVDGQGRPIAQDPAKSDKEVFTAGGVRETSKLDADNASVLNKIFGVTAKIVKGAKLVVHHNLQSLINENGKAIAVYLKKGSTPMAYYIPAKDGKAAEFHVLSQQAYDKYNEATGRQVDANKTYAHEMVHPIISAMLSLDSEVESGLYKQLEMLAEGGNEIAKAALAFGAKYARAGQANKVQNEAVTEFFALMADPARFDTLDRTFKQKVMKMFNELLARLGFDIKVTTDQDLIMMASNIHSAIKLGAEIALPQSNKSYQKRSLDFSLEEETKPAGSRLFNEPLEGVQDIIQTYVEKAGIDYRPGKNINTIDTERAKRIGEAYDRMEHNPTDPAVKKAYEALAKETLAQHQAILDAGYEIEINNAEPYANSADMIADLRDNKRMKIFSTESGFGDTPITDQQRAENPMLRDSGFKDVNGQPLLVNDVFRFVHDFFGHAERGNSFGAKGEENAWDAHSRMYSPEARKAMTTETRGQNSWVNFSGVNDAAFKLRDKARALRKQGKTDEAAAVVEQVYKMMRFADQKVGLLPDEFVQNDYDGIEFSLEQSFVIREGEEVKFKNTNPAMAKVREAVWAERVLEENPMFNFTGTEKIESAADVAYLFRHLESAVSENAFIVFSNPTNGEYRVQWLGTGGTTSQVIDAKQIAAAYQNVSEQLGTDELNVTLVHNHPSGKLQPSAADIAVLDRIQTALRSFGATVRDGVIINLDSGKFSTFSDRDKYGNVYRTKTTDTPVPYAVQSFSRQELYAPSSSRMSIRSPQDVAIALSRLKRGVNEKLGYFVLNQANEIAYSAILDPNESISRKVSAAVADVGRYGETLIIFGNDALAGKQLAAELKEPMSAIDKQVLDVIAITNTDSGILMARAQDGSTLMEDVVGDIDFSLDNPIDVANDVFPVVKSTQSVDDLLSAIYPNHDPNIPSSELKKMARKESSFSDHLYALMLAKARLDKRPVENPLDRYRPVPTEEDKREYDNLQSVLYGESWSGDIRLKDGLSYHKDAPHLYHFTSARQLQSILGSYDDYVVARDAKGRFAPNGFIVDPEKAKNWEAEWEQAKNDWYRSSIDSINEAMRFDPHIAKLVQPMMGSNVNIDNIQQIASLVRVLLDGILLFDKYTKDAPTIKNLLKALDATSNFPQEGYYNRYVSSLSEINASSSNLIEKDGVVQVRREDVYADIQIGDTDYLSTTSLPFFNVQGFATMKGTGALSYNGRTVYFSDSNARIVLLSPSELKARGVEIYKGSEEGGSYSGEYEAVIDAYELSKMPAADIKDLIVQIEIFGKVRKGEYRRIKGAAAYHGIKIVENEVEVVDDSEDISFSLDDRIPPSNTPFNNINDIPSFSLDERLTSDAVDYPKDENVVLSVTQATEQATFDKIDAMLEQFPNPLTNESDWVEIMSRVVGKGGRIPMRPAGLARMAQSVDAIVKELEMVSEGQRELASAGLAGTKEIGELYAEGKMDETDTGMYFLWNIMSIGISPYPQEAGFLRAVDGGIERFIEGAKTGKFNLDAYYKWVDRVLPKGMAGSGSKANLRAFGSRFLAKAALRIEGGEFDGLTRLEALHQILSDRKTPTLELRRKWHAIASGMSFNNKIFDFVLLTTGRSDLFVIDRVRVEHFWDAENLKKEKGMKPGTSIYDGKELVYGATDGAGFSRVLNDVPGLVINEIATRALQPLVREAYARLGVTESPDVGRFHWETWVAMSSQEVSHGSIDAIVQRKKEGDIVDAGIRQGKYGEMDYGFTYRKRSGKEFVYEFVAKNGETYVLDNDGMQALKEEIQEQNSKKGYNGKVGRFILLDEKGNIIKRKTGKAESLSKPWYGYKGVSQDVYEQTIKSFATEVRAASGESLDQTGVDFAIDWYESPEGKGDPAISRRDAQLEEAAQDLLAGRIKNYEFREMAKGLSPIEPITQFFAPASQERMASALSKDKVKSLNAPVAEGQVVALRLDIPAYTSSNTWVVSLHDGLKRDGKVVSYRNVARITDVVFKSNPLAALNIAAGEAKSTIGRMFGKFKSFDGETVEEQAENAKAIVSEISRDRSWKQIGMNPTRASYFYDRASGRPVLSAEEVVQIGGLVYAKNPVYTKWNDPAFQVDGYNDADGSPIYFSLDDSNPDASNLRRTVTRTLGRFSDETRARILANPKAYMTPQSINTVKDNLALLSDDELVENMTAEALQMVANTANPGKGENDISVLAAVELLNRKTANGEDVSELLVNLAQLGTTVGRMLRHFAELKSSTPMGIVETVRSVLKKADRLMTPTQETRLTDIAQRFIDAQRKVADLRDQLIEQFDPAAEAELQKATKDLDKVTRELNKFTSLIVPKKTQDLLTTTIQGNLLTPISQVTNVVANLWQIALSIPVRSFEALGSSLYALFGGQKFRSFPASITALPYAMKQAGVGIGEALITIIKGGSTTEKIVHSGFLPGAAFLAALSDTRFAQAVNAAFGKDVIKGDVLPRLANGKIAAADRAKALYEGMFGVAPEIMFRFLALGDKPFYRFAEAMQLAQEADKLGLKGEARRTFLKYPSKKAAKTADEAAKRLTFQQDSQAASAVFQVMKTLGRIPGVGKVLEFMLKVSLPYVKTPANIFTETMAFAIPGFGFARGAQRIWTGKTQDGISDMAKAATGQMIIMAANQLIAQGLIQGAFTDEDDEERALGYLRQPPMTVNIDGLIRLLNGEDPAWQPTDRVRRYDKLGIVGMVMGARVTAVKNNLTKSKDKEEGYYVGEEKSFFEPFTYVWDQLGVPLATFQTLNQQSFLAGSSSLLKVLSGGASERDVEDWFESTFRALTAVPFPNTLSAIHRGMREYMPSIKTKNPLTKFKYVVMDRLFMTDGIPARVDAFGEKIPQTPAGANRWMYNLADPTKAQETTGDLLWAEIWRVYSLNEESKVIPGFPSKLTQLPTKNPLNSKPITGWNADVEEKWLLEMERLQIMYGKEQREIVNDLVSSDYYNASSNEDKEAMLIEVLDAYQSGRKPTLKAPISGFPSIKRKQAWLKEYELVVDQFFK